MSECKKNRIMRKRRAFRVRERVKRTGVLRVSIFRTTRHIYAQVIDDAAHATLVSCSTIELENLSGDKKTQAHAVGKELAVRSLSKGISAVAFDRGSFRYHGRVKALADGLREGGIQV